MNKQVLSEVKFTDLDWASPAKEVKIGDMINFKNKNFTKNNNIFVQKESLKKINTQSVVQHQVAPFDENRKSQNLNHKMSKIVNKFPDRKKSVQSYNNIQSRLLEKNKFQKRENTYKSNRHSFYKRDGYSNTSSRTKFLP